jgi:hypothetical protein
MNRLGLHIISLFALSFLLGGNLFSQESLERDSFVIVKEFVPTLSQASKIRINPEINDTHQLDLNLNYAFLNKRIETDFKPEPIKPATLSGEPLVKLYRSHLIVGYGNNATPLAEFYFSQLRHKKISYALYGRHLSSNGIHNIENSNFSNNAIGANGNFYTRKFTFTGRLKYKYDQVNYYGFDKDLPGLDVGSAEKNEDIMQFYNNINVAVGMGNNQRDTVGLRHYSEMSFSHVEDRFGASENRFVLKENMSLLNKTDIYLFDWAVDYNKYGFQADNLILDSTYENTLLYLKPGIELKGSKWTLVGKLQVVGDFNRKTKLFVFPHADFRYQLVKSIIIPYVGITGDMKRNTYAGFYEENPFISPILHLENTREKMTFYAGIGGNLSKNTSFDVSYAQTNYANMALYVKDTNARENRSFNVVYDDVNVNKFTAEIIYEPLKKWNLAVRGDYFMYKTTDELEAWHKPDYHFSVLLGYNLGDKVLVKLMTYLIGQQKAKLYTAEKSERLKGVADINLNFEYRYTKKIGVFLDFNNLASVRYQKWQDYPTQRFNAIGGFKFSF